MATFQEIENEILKQKQSTRNYINYINHIKQIKESDIYWKYYIEYAELNDNDLICMREMLKKEKQPVVEFELFVLEEVLYERGYIF